MKFVIIFTIAFVLFIPVSVFAQTQSHIGTLYIEKDTFEIPFDKKIPVILSGNIKSPLGQKFVTLSIVNPDDEPDGVKIVPSSNGDFNHIMEFDSQSLLGTYNIIASYNGVIFENISFVIKDKTPSIEDILKERGEKIIKNEETPIEPEPVKEIPKDVRHLFLTAMDLSPDDHVKMQAAFQKHVDNAISKTVNFPHHATVDDIQRVFMLAYDLGCKGITVYRDGSLDNQVLNGY